MNEADSEQNLSSPLNFQTIILLLQNFWSSKNCAILQPYDMEMGAGTSHPATILDCLGPKNWNVAYVQPSRRPTDGRYGENPNRLYKYNQFQVILKPAPLNTQELYLESLKILGINIDKHDIRFVEDDWENPSLGASGLGWEVWFDGMEITQFTYMQQIGGIDCVKIPCEITYGLERLAMYIQDKSNVYDLKYNEALTYSELYLEYEKQMSSYCLEFADSDILFKHFNDFEQESKNMIEKKLPIAAYEQTLKASNCFNLLDARGKISVGERARFIARIRSLAKSSCELWLSIGKSA